MWSTTNTNKPTAKASELNPERTTWQSATTRASTRLPGRHDERQDQCSASVFSGRAESSTASASTRLPGLPGLGGAGDQGHGFLPTVNSLPAVDDAWDPADELLGWTPESPGNAAAKRSEDTAMQEASTAGLEEDRARTGISLCSMVAPSPTSEPPDFSAGDGSMGSSCGSLSEHLRRLQERPLGMPSGDEGTAADEGHDLGEVDALLGSVESSDGLEELFMSAEAELGMMAIASHQSRAASETRMGPPPRRPSGAGSIVRLDATPVVPEAGRRNSRGMTAETLR